MRLPMCISLHECYVMLVYSCMLELGTAVPSQLQAPQPSLAALNHCVRFC